MQRDRRGQSVTIGGNRKVGAVVLGQYNVPRWIKEGQRRGKDELQENLGYFSTQPPRRPLDQGLQYDSRSLTTLN